MMKITKEARVGFIVVVVIAMFYWGFNFLKGRDLFQKTHEYYVWYSRIGGLRESNIVTINGYQVGVVKEIKFDIRRPSHLLACLAIDSKVRLPKESVARIENIDLLGTVGVGLILSDSKVILADRDTLIGDNELSLNEQIAPLKNKVENMLVSLDSTLTTLRHAMDIKTINTAKKSLENIHDITLAIAEQRQKIGILLDQLVLVSGNEKLSKSINNLYEISDSLKNANLSSTFRNLNKVIIQTDKVMTKINSSQSTFGHLVNEDSIYTDIQKTNHDLDSLINDVNRNPKKYVHFSIFGRHK
jgi:phospholipid/cholesterol/gamma-HCH transport system substrate-binding protein